MDLEDKKQRSPPFSRPKAQQDTWDLERYDEALTKTPLEFRDPSIHQPWNYERIKCLYVTHRNVWNGTIGPRFQNPGLLVFLSFDGFPDKSWRWMNKSFLDSVDHFFI